jgi:hypothetical protein
MSWAVVTWRAHQQNLTLKTAQQFKEPSGQQNFGTAALRVYGMTKHRPKQLS